MDARLDERHSVQSRQALRELGVKRIRFRMDLSGRPTASWTPHTTRRPVRSDLAMTGEISPRGKVLPVGGIKEKVLAAHRVGIREVILPRRNQRDIEDVPEDLRREIAFVFVDDAEEVLRHALSPAVSAVARAAR